MPGSTESLTRRDREILECLTLRVRFFSLAQLGRTWWNNTADPADNAQRRIQQLVRRGLLQTHSILAHPELNMNLPIFTWRPNQPEPDFGPLAYRLQSRWRETPIPTTVVGATRTAGRRFGGAGGRRPKRAEGTHDLHFSAVFLRFRIGRSQEIDDWQSEAEIEKRRPRIRGQKLPDAMIQTGENRHAVEFGGAYDKRKLTGFHQWCEAERISYEVW